MGEPGREEYKIQCFDAETQQLLKTALKDPGAVDLEKVANLIVDHSLQDSVFSKEAGRMCYAIIQAESKQAGQSVFRRGLLNRLQQEYQTREQLRARSLQGWVCYVTFICNIFDYLRVNNMPMMALVNPVYDCLFRLAQPDSLSKEEEHPKVHSTLREEMAGWALSFLGEIQVDVFLLCKETGEGEQVLAPKKEGLTSNKHAAPSFL
uniref:MIF4G domain containing n=1 Tax=Equus caballus TaxID=9796 RepID=A0A9L0S422_HORSE|nr:MIF4G domain-containing protein isoform X1 [Equus asinus]